MITVFKAVGNYLKEYFSDIKLSEITFKSLTKAASSSVQNNG